MRSLRNKVSVLLFKQKNKCCYCECPLTRETATIEHLKRRKDGGKSCNDNLAVACESCNHGRGQIDWFTYKSWIMGELFYETT